MSADRAAQGRRQIAALLDRHGLHPRRSLGQHFLADPNLVERIVRVAGVGPGDRVVEVGAGTGTLTVALAEAGARVVAYEVDERLRGVLEEVVGDRPDVEVRFADAARVDLGTALEGGPWKLVANLPYHVGTGIVLDVLRHAPQVEELVVMVQREVADRLLAEPGTKTYGLPSVVVGLHADVRFEFPVPREVFLPVPNVDSAVVRIRRRPASEAAEGAIELAAAAFSQRRKMLRRSLASVLPDPVRVLEAAGISPTARAEELAPADYLALAEAAEGS
ncbi:MAG TPA: 16S rRNA (adenine(1518)-N(6)/adenine(1519)-N(6))-dimethyltransferase RsmA [Actinobacteria bacterium]|nr:16S rRNA (adenine(1518)-N(6)/adenine(1519)-N(6))-dimethyltransferase RsmA [Actinomycetota bacterium]